MHVSLHTVVNNIIDYPLTSPCYQDVGENGRNATLKGKAVTIKSVLSASVPATSVSGEAVASQFPVLLLTPIQKNLANNLVSQ